MKKHPDKEYDHNLIAICFSGSSIVSYGFNTDKTDPIMVEISKKFHINQMYHDSSCNWVTTSRHAEVSALKKANTPVDKIGVFRFGSKGEPLKSKPCLICQKIMEVKKVSNVYYFDNDGKMVEKKVL